MAITDSQKVDYLFKKIGYGISKTDTSTVKSPSNETVASPLTLRGDIIWQQGASIPGTQPSSSAGVVQVYSDATGNSIECTADTTSTANRTWLTGLTDWISPEYGGTYQVKLYLDSPGSTTPQTTGVRVYPDGSGNNDEWFFDYSSGVLNFIGSNLPSVSFTGKKVFVVGSRYTGQKGLTSFPGGLTVGNVHIEDNTVSIINLDGELILAGNGAGNVLIANLQSNSIIANTITSSGSVEIGGEVNISGNTVIGGNLTVNGDIVGFSANTITMFDSLLYIATNNTESDEVDIGIVGHYNNGYDAHTGIIRDAQTKEYYIFDQYTVEPEINDIDITNPSFHLANLNVSNISLNNGLVLSSSSIISTEELDILTQGNVTISTPGIVVFDSNTALVLPTGNTSQRPTVQAGAMRYNTQHASVEYFNGTEWVFFTNSVSQQTFSGDNTETTFALDYPASAETILVSINGTIQNPSTAYTVTTQAIIFSEPPLTSDVIDIRYLASASEFINMESVGGDIFITANLIPSANAVYSLGSETRWWKDLWLSDNTLYLGGIPVTVTAGGELLVNNQPVQVTSYGNAQVAQYLPIHSGNVNGTLTTSSQPYITEIGTITSGTWLGSTIEIEQGGTGATSPSEALANLLPTGEVNGYVLTTGGSGNYYWAEGGSGGGGGGGINTGTIINSTRDTFTATAGQTLFTGVSTYTPGSGQLRIYYNGVRQFPSDYVETSADSFTLNEAANAGDVLLAEVDAYTYSTVYANVVVYDPIGNISPTATTVELAINDLQSTADELQVEINNLMSTTANLAGAEFSGDVKIIGNLTVANLLTQSTTTLSVDAPLVYLVASDTYPYDYDLGLYSHFVGGSANTYQHTGIVRNHTDHTWTFFSNIPEPIGGVVNLSTPDIVYDKVKAGSLILANVAGTVLSVSGNATINGSSTFSGNTIVDNTLYAHNIYDNSIRVVSRSSGSGNLTITNGNINLPAHGPTAGTYGAATHTQVVTVDGFGRISAIANTQIALTSTQVTDALGFTPISATTNTNTKVNSLGVGTDASGTAGEIRATNNITAYYSDDRLKTKLGPIENALDKIDQLAGFYYEANETAQALGYSVKREVGISAQDTLKVLPEITAPAPIDEQYLTIHYDRFAPLLVEGIKELRAELNAIKKHLGL
jgi:hypothetical protein